MNVDCPSCHTTFPVDPAKVPEGGVHARCSVCDEVFFVQAPPAPQAAPEPGAFEPEEVGEAAEEGIQPGPGTFQTEPEAEPVVEEPQDVEPTYGAPEATFTMDQPLPTPQFGKRDPKEKAHRLARVLVSDIILYNPDRHQKALEAGNLKEEFEEEIEKSWEEYVEQVGEDMANSTDFFNEALNEILAKGQSVF